nr:hypothetical protein [Tanacetum cinerariifolium]
MILESVEHGLLIWPTIEENGVIRTKKYAELSVAEKYQANCDMKATNIILQGLPSDIYSLVNHHGVAKDQWKRIQLLMQGDDPIACLNKAIAFLTAIASSRVTVQQVQRRQGQNYSVIRYKSNANSLGKTIQVNRQGLLNVTTVKVKDIWLGNALSLRDQGMQHAVLMANISNYGSDVISWVPHSETYLNDMENQSVLAMQDFEQPPNVDFTDNEIHSDSNIILLTEDFEKRFTPQQELSGEQAFWLRMFDPTSKPSDALPVKIKAPKELSKISLWVKAIKGLNSTLPNLTMIKGKEIVDIAAQKPSGNTIVLEMFKLYLEPLAP